MGRAYLAAVVELLHLVRASHPTAGVWEAADFEWWWRKPRPTDEWDQLFWFVADRPVAAAIATDWGGRLGLDVITLPGESADFVGEVFHRGVELTSSAPVEHIEVMVDAEDAVMTSLLVDTGFSPLPDSGTSAWMNAEQRPLVSPLAAGYRLASRRELTNRPHRYVSRNGPNVEQRLRETTLYRPDLDLALIDQTGDVVADGLFWYDPITEVGFVEPIGTHDHHRRLGLARPYSPLVWTTWLRQVRGVSRSTSTTTTLRRRRSTWVRGSHR